MRLVILSALLIAVFGALMTLLVVPRQEEMAYMYLRGNDFEQSLDAFENRQQREDATNIAVIGGLARLRLQEGKIDEAIAILEKFVSENPKNIQAHMLLGIYYQYSERQSDYLRNLEKLIFLTEINQNTKPQERKIHTESLRTLADNYNFQQNFSAQKTALEHLIADGDASVEDRYNLAELEAMLGNKEEALALMLQLYKMTGRTMSDEMRVLLLSLLIDQNRNEDAIYFASVWLGENKKPNPERMEYFARMMWEWGSYEVALNFLKQYEDAFKRSPKVYKQVLATYLAVTILSENDNSAYMFFSNLVNENKLPENLYPKCLIVALRHDDSKMMQQSLKKVKAENVANADLRKMLEIIWQKDFAEEKVKKNLEDLSSFFANSKPLNGSSSYRKLLVSLLQYNNTEIMRPWLSATFNDFSLQERISLLNLFSISGHYALLGRVVSTFKKDDKSLDGFLEQATIAYVDSGLSAEVPEFLEIRRKRVDLNDGIRNKILRAEALFFAASGQTENMRKWLEEHAGFLQEDFVDRLYYTAFDRGHYEVATMVAEKLFKNFASNKNHILWIQSLIKENKKSELEEQLQAFWPVRLPLSEDALMVITDAVALYPKSEIVLRYSNDLNEYWQENLQQQILASAGWERAVYALLALKSYDAILPGLRDVSLTDPEKWGSYYLQALASNGQNADAYSFFMQVMKTDLQLKQKEALLYDYAQSFPLGDVMEILRPHALKGEDPWFYVYETELKKANKKDELHKLWLSVASEEKISENLYGDIAYRLLEIKEFERANFWLKRFAEKRSVNDMVMQDLAYFWKEHPRFKDILFFVRRARADSEKNLGVWLSYLNLIGAHQVVLDLAANSVKNNDVKEAELLALVRLKRLAEAEPLLIRYIASANDIKNLRLWGDLAREAGFYAQAYKAFEKAFLLDQSDVALLETVATLAYGNGNFDQARKYYERYLAEAPQQQINIAPQIYMQLGRIYRTLFEQSRRSNKEYSKKAANYFSRVREQKNLGVFDDMEEEGDGLSAGDVDLGKVEEQIEYVWAAFYLNKKRKAEKEMKALLRAYPKTPMVFFAYADLLLQLKKEKKLMPLLQEWQARLEGEEISPRVDSEQRKILLGQLNLLKARAYQQQGKWDEVDNLLTDVIKSQVPGSPILVEAKLMQAQSEIQAGKIYSADQHLRAAEKISPENGFVLAQINEFRKIYAPSFYTSIDHYRVRNGEHSSNFSTVIQGSKLPFYKMQAALDVRYLRVPGVYNKDLVLGEFNGSRKRADISLEVISQEDHLAKISLFADDSGPGIGFKYSVPGKFNTPHVNLEYQRPYWDLPQGAIWNAGRDQIGVGNSLNYKKLRANFEVGYRNYTVDKNQEIADGVYGVADFDYALIDDKDGWRASLYYAIDSEYLDDKPKKRAAANGELFSPLPLESRETHSVGTRVSKEIREDIQADIYGGYSYDRLGGKGPIAGVGINYVASELIDAGVRADYAKASLGDSGEALRTTVFLRMRF